MKTNLVRLPQTFTVAPGLPVFTNLDDIHAEIEDTLKSLPVFCYYTDKNFNGKVWWSAALENLCGEVWKERGYITTYVAKTLPELVQEMIQERKQV
ncbi:MAG TPA: hypothetical protein VM802_19685 [Chitinophaga sp.]|uniref:hypothetical protein n=1 Tax=Chitinophaga sp. TaxID=1869181 RepID=UPI002CCAF385|nr:hypothetical protein [Chitinophaga sp.]HVI47108.1 hypothetical protein [Chitinophaga sp.]